MDIYKHKWTRLQSEIFSLLCLKTGEKLSQRDISKLLNVSPTAVANSLRILQKDQLILVEKMKNINFISFNRDEKKAIELKRIENLRNIYDSKLLEYLERELPGGTIILFGSYSYGEDIGTSDIDLAIIGRKEKNLKLDEFENILNRKININFYSSFKEIHRDLKNNILRGIVLEGTVEL